MFIEEMRFIQDELLNNKNTYHFKIEEIMKEENISS